MVNFNLKVKVELLGSSQVLELFIVLKPDSVIDLVFNLCEIFVHMIVVL